MDKVSSREIPPLSLTDEIQIPRCRRQTPPHPPSPQHHLWPLGLRMGIPPPLLNTQLWIPPLNRRTPHHLPHFGPARSTHLPGDKRGDILSRGDYRVFLGLQ